MAVELALPGRRVAAPKPPSYLALDMAFGVGDPAILGDKSRYRSHGTIVGAVPAAGVHGYCLDFDPTIPSYVLIPATATQLNFTSEDFSLIARVNLDALLATRAIFTRGAAIVDGYYFDIRANGEIRLTTNTLGFSVPTRSTAGIIVAGTWYTLGFSRTGTTVTLFRNGVDVTLIPGVHADPVTCARTAKIGIYDDLVSSVVDGKIEFLRIFRNIALPTSSHLAWHNALA